MSPSAISQSASSPSSLANALADSLQPTLRNALSSLNVQLDHELARYRRAKHGGTVPTRSPQFRARRQSVALAGERPATHTVMPPPPPPNPRLATPDTATAAPSASATLPTDTAIAAAAQTPTSEVSALRSALVHRPAPAQDDYLASSEALLQSFEPNYSGPMPDTVTRPPQSRWFEQWNTPLGLGALMLLLVASAGFGFVVVNPVAVRHLVDQTPLARFWSNPEDAAIAEGDTPPAASGEEGAIAASPEVNPLSPLSPDLSQQEFRDLDLGSLSTLPSSAVQPEPDLQATPLSELDTPDTTAPSNSAGTAPATSAPSPPGPTTVPYSQATVARPDRPASAPVSPVRPSEPAAPAETAAAAPSSSAPSTPYYVVADYTGDPSLSEAREVVGDAYVRNFDMGARIQLGAFSNASSAAALVEDLRTQGIEAQVYEP